MAASLSGLFNLQVLTNTGAPAFNYRLYTWTQGTTTQKTAYTDAAGTVAHAYVSDGAGGLYIALNARGELPAPLFLTTGPYDIALKDTLGAAVWTRYSRGQDDASAISDAALRADLASTSDATKGDFLLGVKLVAAGAVARTQHSKNADSVSVTDFGADITGAVSFSAALQAAIDYLPSGGGKITIPSGAYLSSTQINVNKPLLLVLEGVVITTASAVGFDHTSVSFVIQGAGDSTSVIKHSGASHCIYSHGTSPVTGAQIARFVVENVGLVDLLTTQATALFVNWSTTRTTGAGIYSITPQTVLRNVNTFGFFDGIKATNILASTWDNVRSAWSARDGLHIGASSTSVTLNSCYVFAPQRDGIRIEDNVFYCAMNATASDAAGRYAYYFGPGEINGLSPANITLNSIGAEESGYLNTAGATVYLDGVKGLVFNAPQLTGFGARLANTVSGIVFAGGVSSYVSINLGQLGFLTSELGGYGLYIPTGKYAGKLTIVGQPVYYTTSSNVLDADHVVEYLQGNQPYRYTFQATESTAGGAIPMYLTSFYDTHSDNTVTTYKVTMTARQTAGAGGTIGQGASYVFYKTIRLISGVITYVGATVFAMSVENDAAWDVDLVNNSGGARIIVTGAANETISWQYTVERNRVST